MAQIIKHRRGSLESVSGATKRAGELLVVTGSSGITATNGDSILFVGIDGSTATPANKILQGTSVPNLSGGSYDTSIDGIPYYDTSAQKLYILNKGGNVEVKATANTGGTGIVSGSSQVIELLPTGTVSGSSQVTISSTTGYTDFSSSLNTRLATASSNITELYTTASDHEGRIDTIETSLGGGGSLGTRVTNLETFSGSQEAKDSTLATYTGSIDADLSALHTFSASQETKDSTLATYTGSVTSDLTALRTFTASQESKDSTLATYTGSVDISLSALNTYSASLKTAFELTGSDVVVLGNLQVKGTQTIVNSTTVQVDDNIIELNGSGVSNAGIVVRDATSPNTASGSLLWNTANDFWMAGTFGNESRILVADGMGVVSGSAQILDGTGIVSSSGQVISLLPSGVVSGSSQILGGSGIVSGSPQVVTLLEGKDVALAGISGSSLDISGNAKIDGNVTIGGRVILGEQSADQISIGGELVSDIIPSGSNERSLGSSTKLFANVYSTNLYGSINATNGVISGSSQVDADSITNFDTNVLAYNNSLGVISGSSQLDGTTINNLTTTASGSFSGSFQGDGSQLTGIASTLALSGSTGNDSINLKTESLLVTGSTGISTNVANNTITISGTDASTSAKGVASFDGDDFSVTTGNVSIKDGGVKAVNLNSNVAGTGISLNGADNSIEVDFGSTAGTAVEGNTSLTVQGTTNQIEVSGGSITLGNGGTVTIGLPDDVTISGSLTANGNVFLGNSTADSVTIAGNLYVQGTTTTVDSATIQLGDNIIELNGSGVANGGLLVKDVTNPNTASGSLLWDSTNDYWKGGALGSEKEFARFNATATSGSVQVIGANGLLVDSAISDDASNVTIGTDLIISGLTANSFLYADSAKTLTSVAPSNAGDMIQWNGSSFVASNTIDGGTF